MFEDLPEIKHYIQNIRVLENRKFLMAIETGLQNGKLMSDFLVNASSFSSYDSFQKVLVTQKKLNTSLYGQQSKLYLYMSQVTLSSLQ